MDSKDKGEKGKTGLDQIRASLRHFLRIRDLQQKLDPRTGEPGRPLANDELKHWRDSLSEDEPKRSRVAARSRKKD